MKMYQNPLWMGTLFMVISIFACVTINIYFPAEKVESVAGEIVDDIRGRKSGEKKNSLKNDKDSYLRNTLLSFAPSLVWAQDVTGVSNPTIRALKEKMKERYTLMKPYYDKGSLTEGNDGYVSLEKIKGLGLKQKRDLKTLVEAENKDRETLYKEVAKALKIDVNQVHKIAEIFAKEWQK
ncbi:MAG: DUF1318 domain-containing protein [Thermodesulfobacteriota bacterium]|nr:DUF1318 domain-containing protein [Thermodesulfobacteriota bacterium]